MSTRRTRIRHKKRRRGSSKLVLMLFAGMFAFGVIGVSSVIGWIIYTATTGPKIQELKPREQGRSSKIFAADGTRIGFFQSRVVREPVASTEIPDFMRQATVAVEDRRFYDHKGVDFEGVVRAAFRNLTSGKTVEGGSTLTMQLVRALYAGKERNITRKIREAKLAEELENIHHGPEGKRWILNQYLNNVPYGTAGGQEIIGVQAAARAYYDKPARDLSLAQSAMIAGLPQAPTQYNPLIYPEAAKKRRDDVLNRMLEQGMITGAQASGAKAQELKVVSKSSYYSTRTEGYVFDYVKKQLVAKYGRSVVSRGGLKVYTTIDLKKQREARAAIKANLNGEDPPSAAIVTISPSSGAIVAMASSGDYGQSRWNLAAQEARQPGSTFKTMALMAAVRKGVVPESTYYTSKPLNITTGAYADAANPIKVKTYGGTYGGSMNLVKGTLTSDNTVYMQLALDIGPDAVKKAAVDMGIKSKLLGVPAESLGGLNEGVTPLEMANAYATIASGGYKNTPTAISKVVFPKSQTYPKGRTDDLGHPKRAKTFQNGVTGEVTKILQQNVQGGTGTRAQTQCPTAGKTGTTDNFRDAWFAGFTPKYASAIWVGYPAPRVVEMRSQFGGASVAGGTYPAQIWGQYMKEALKGQPCGTFKQITEPVTASKFEGKFAKSGGKDTGDEDGEQAGTTTTTPDTVGTPGVKTPTKKPSTTTGGTGGGTNTGGGTGGTGGGTGGGGVTIPTPGAPDGQ